MKNQLSKREYKYRCKIIAENHLQKECQAYLDSYVDSKWLTYKDVYLNKVVLLRIKAAYNFQSASKAMWKSEISAKQASDAFQNFAQTLMEDDIDKGVILIKSYLRKSVRKVDIKHFKYPKDMDEECIPMCDFFNTIGLKTKFACCGHNVGKFEIIFADEVGQDSITSFIERISDKYDHTPLIGGFSMWVRKCDNKIACNWVYSISYNTLLKSPIIYAAMDLNTMIAKYK